MHNSQSSHFRDVSHFPFFACVIASLYISQGLPGGFIAHALPVFLREEGMSLTLIGFLKLLALPWLLKFLWAPYIDRSASLSHRRSWVFRMQMLSALGLFLLSFLFTGTGAIFLAGACACLLLINLASATQDIATDGLTASNTPNKKLGIANSIQVVGYKIGMIVGGSGLLYMSQYAGLPDLVRALSVFLLLLLIPLCLLKDAASTSIEASKVKDEPYGLSVYRGLFHNRAFMKWLAVLLTYKVADALGSAMIKPLLVDLGFQKSDIGEIVFISSFVGMAGALIGGVLYVRLKGVISLAAFGVLQTVSIASFYFVSSGFVDISYVAYFVSIEQFCDGLSTVALFAMMMAQCRKGHEGADYTLQASIQIVLAGVIGALSGVIAQFLGYGALYILCGVIGGLSVMIVLHYGRQVRVADLPSEQH